MQPFFSSTRATIISCPTTNCRCNSGFSSSSGMLCQGIYCSAAVPAAGLTTARFARYFFVLTALVLAGDFDFFLAMRILYGLYRATREPCSFLATVPRTAPNCKRKIVREDWVVGQFEILMACSLIAGVILSVPVLQAERRISRYNTVMPREIP